MNAWELHYCILFQRLTKLHKETQKNYFSSVFSLSNGIGLLIEDVNMEQLSAMHLKWSHSLDSLFLCWSALLNMKRVEISSHLIYLSMILNLLAWPYCFSLSSSKTKMSFEIITIACTTTEIFFFNLSRN